jgi:uncharacterized membrane protein YcaP (DUF421 family)
LHRNLLKQAALLCRFREETPMIDGSEVFRVLFGEADTATAGFYVEIVFRTVVMYLYTIVLARLMGQGSVGQIGPFEFVLVIAVGSAAGDPMFYPDVGLAQGIAVITVVMIMHRLTGALIARSRRLEQAVEGRPLLVVRDGAIVEDALRGGALTRRELMALLRVAGIRNTGEVECAFFETSGRLSVFQADERRAGVDTFPAADEISAK